VPAPLTGEGVAASAFRAELVEHGLLIETGVPGIFGRSAEFEDTVDRVDRLVTAAGRADNAQTLRFPPVLSRRHFEASGYLKSFPHLVGAVTHFEGGERNHRELLQAVQDGGDWSAAFRAAPLVLTPAACYPVYPALGGVLPAGGRLIDVMSYCYRHEPSEDPARMQMFRMHEHVRAGDAELVRQWRDRWIDRVRDVTSALGLAAVCGAASDPFFGRGGKLLAGSQRDQRLKLEFTAPIASDAQPTAIVSLNYHQDYFGRIFGIDLPDGTPAHTACVGFGLERVALALYRRHGLARGTWKSSVRSTLGL
jgi:seryl-tRNA synthetase